jgi:DNA polymerase-3 subunit epsilon
MTHEDVDTVPQRGTLLRRAHELLESQGQPVSEDRLIQHLFGASTDSAASHFWTILLRQTLQSSSLFEQTEKTGSDGSIHWSLSTWHSTQRFLDEIDFVVLDTETTGLRPGSDRVIEIAGVRLHHGKATDAFQSLVNPGRRIPPFITKFTGITQDMVNDAPPAAAILPDFFQFIEGATLVGHNLGFDLNFLSHEAQLLGQTFPVEGFDTVLLARRLLPSLKRFKLDTVAEYLKIPTANRHRAMGDARATAAIFLRLLEYAQTQGIHTVGHLRLRLQLPVSWSGDISQEAITARNKQWRADGKLAPSLTRPNGSLFLNPAWKRNFPGKPGVYLMKDEYGQVIYVGKAKNLKERLASYYSHPLGYIRKMDGLLQNVREIETRVLGSELEALLVESQLIKQLQPAYNVQLRNYELYPFIKIDIQHPFPRVYATREVAADGARYFGPFRSRRVVDATIELIQKLFPIRTCTRGLPPTAKPSDPCLRLHLGRCPGPCRGGVDATEYHKTIAEVCAFLGGSHEDLFDRLRRQMFEASQQLNFERAAWLRDAIRNADEVLTGQRLITGAVEANNLFIIYPSAKEEHNEIFLIRHGRLLKQHCTLHTEMAMKQSLSDLLDHALALEKPPDVVGQAEVDQINIISRWIHRHSDDCAFFSFQHALAQAEERHNLVESIWLELDAVRTQIEESSDEEEIPWDQVSLDS